MEDGCEATRNFVLNAHYYGKTYHCDPSHYLLMDPFLFALNSFAHRIGNEHEHEEQERRMNESKARNWGKRR